MTNSNLITYWYYFTPLFILLGIGAILFAFKYPQKKTAMIATDFRGFGGGIMFIILGIMLFVEAHFKSRRIVILSCLLITGAIIFYMITEHLRKKGKIKNNRFDVILVTLLIIGIGIYVLFL